MRWILQPSSAPATAGPAPQGSDEAPELPTPEDEWPQETNPEHGLKLKEPLESRVITPGRGPFGWRDIYLVTNRCSRKQSYIVRIYQKRYNDVKFPLGEEGAFACAQAADRKRIELGLDAVNLNAATGEPLNKSYIGLYLTNCGTWSAKIWLGGRLYYCGCSRSLEAAKKAYDQKALLYGKDTNYRYE